MRWVFAMRRPSSSSGSRFASVSDSITLARAPATSSFGSDGGSSRGTSRAALFVNRINTDRRSGLCGTHWEAMAMAFPVYRADRARRDFTQSLDGRIWWLTLARLGCSTRTRRESSRPRHWAYLRRRSTVSLRRPIGAIPTAGQTGRRLGETALQAARELCPDWRTLRALRRL